MARPMDAPITSGSKYGIDHPPWVNPPSVSSSAPPGAWTTPSRLMKSLTMMRMTAPLEVEIVDTTSAEAGTHRYGVKMLAWGRAGGDEKNGRTNVSMRWSTTGFASGSTRRSWSSSGSSARSNNWQGDNASSSTTSL